MLLDPGYDNAPTREIDQAIAWLEDQAYDCQAKIAALQSLKRQRAAQAKYRANLKALVSDIAHKDFINYSAKDQIEAIRQRTGADYDRAKKMVPLVKRLANNEKRRNNRVKIAYLHEAGFSAARIAEKIGQSRQNVHLILKSLQSDPVF